MFLVRQRVCATRERWETDVGPGGNTVEGFAWALLYQLFLSSTPHIPSPPDHHPHQRSPLLDEIQMHCSWASLSPSTLAAACEPRARSVTVLLPSRPLFSKLGQDGGRELSTVWR